MAGYDVVVAKLFNSHPHKEDDVNHSILDLQVLLFNSHPHKEDDIRLSSFSVPQNFSTHILTRRMTVCLEELTEEQIFQLTSSQGG